MNIEIIRKLNLTRENFCLPEPYQYLNVYHYKKDVYMADTGFSDGVSNVNLIYRNEVDHYNAMPDDYILDVPVSLIDKGFKLD
jgi:hypothetical protein